METAHLRPAPTPGAVLHVICETVAVCVVTRQPWPEYCAGAVSGWP